MGVVVVAVGFMADVAVDAADDADVEGAASDWEDIEPIRQTVSQPARGHQVRDLSNSISIRERTLKTN